MYFGKPFATIAHIHSLGGELQKATMLEKLGDNDYLAEYDGVKCHAIYNPFVSRFYVDDVDAVVEDDPSRKIQSKYIDRKLRQTVLRTRRKWKNRQIA